MKKIVLISCISLGLSAQCALAPLFSDFLVKKMQKYLSKTFTKDIKTTAIPSSDSTAFNHVIYQVSHHDSLLGYSVLSRGLGCKIGGCDKPKPGQNNFEQFFYMTAFLPEGTIKKVRVLSYTSDHGYQITNRSWLNQFEGGQNFQVGKNIDAISGATISVNSISNGVNKQQALIQSTIGQ